MRSVIIVKAMENFRGQTVTGEHSYDLKNYTVLEMYPFEVFGLDAEMKKTKYAITFQIRENSTGNKERFYASEIKIVNS